MTTNDPIPQEWVGAFAEGWHSVQAGQPGDRRRAGLAKVLPLIEAEVRERVAREIEAVCGSHTLAARIARGGAQ